MNIYIYYILADAYVNNNMHIHIYTVYNIYVL